MSEHAKQSNIVVLDCRVWLCNLWCYSSCCQVWKSTSWPW